MWFKILQVVQFICSLIAEAESRFVGAAGSEKRSDVMKSLSAELRKEGMLGDTVDPKHDAVLKAAGDVVDSTVALLNETGAFSHALKPEPAEDLAPAAEAVPEG